MIIDLPARPDHFIEFYLAEPYAVSEFGGNFSSAPEIALVSPHTRPGKRLMTGGEVDNFTIHFMPSGLHRLFGTPFNGLADLAIPAAELLGGGIVGLRDQLARASSFEDRVDAADAFFGAALMQARHEDGVDRAMRALLSTGHDMPVPVIAREAGLGQRQFSRQFIRRSGLTPNLYGRLLRFYRLLAAYNATPRGKLTILAHDAGYYDQAHFIRDCHDFTGKAPRAYLDPSARNGSDRFIQLFDHPSI